ncbi:MAG TPA: site-2 protease family protein, partial [Methylomirabilota bacterium]|nr:site-2 protease family protein [Methylomirabilota bacterium]
MLTDLSPLNLLVVLVSLVVGLTVHEAMHGFVAHWLGDDTAHREGRLTLNPLAHIDVLTTILLPMVMIILHAPPILAAKPVPFNPDRLKFDEWGAALVGLAGPLTNLALAALAAVVWRLT